MRIKLTFVVLILSSIYGFSQPDYHHYSIFEFSLGKFSDTLSFEKIKNKEIKFYSAIKFNSNLKYSKKNNLFYFSSDLGKLYIISKSDTVLIKTPVLLIDGFDKKGKIKIIVIKDIIKIETGFYDFDTDMVKSFLFNNKSCNLTENGHCEIFYFYLPKKEKLVVKKEDFKYLKEIQIEEDE
jgi:hypothetical protein